MENENKTSLEETALKRKERLKNLKRKKNNEDPQSDNTEKEIKPKFRSYRPQDKTLNENNEVEDHIEDGIEEQIKDQLDLLKTPITIDEVDITNLAPRKQDWDLKRDIAKKLEKLEWRTQKAIAELIRERLQMNEETICESVNVATAEVESNQNTT